MPILDRSDGLQTALGQLWQRVKNAENVKSIRQKSSQASGRRAKTANMQFALVFTSQNCPRARKPMCFYHFLGGVSKASNLAPRRLDLHNLTTLADLTSRTPSGAVPEAKLGRSWASSGALLAPRSPLRWVFFRSSSTSLAAQPDLNRSMPTPLISQTSRISAVTNRGQLID